METHFSQEKKKRSHILKKKLIVLLNQIKILIYSLAIFDLMNQNFVFLSLNSNLVNHQM